MFADTVFLADEAATESFGRMLARAASNLPASALTGPTIPTATLGGCIHLRGDLGAGKTTLTRGLLRGYGYEGAVKSPTYTLVEPYEFPGCNIYHFDLYRLFDPQEVEFLGVSTYFNASNLCLIEWPEHGRNMIPEPDIEIELSAQGQGRNLAWWARSDRGQEIAERLLENCRNP